MTSEGTNTLAAEPPATPFVMNDASGAAQRSCDIPDACPHLVKASTGKRVEP
jgi:hypothetical protein